MASRFLDALAVKAFDGIQWWMMRLSDMRAERFGERVAMIAFRIDKKHRLRTISNLELGFPEWTDAKRLETAKGVYRHFGRMFVQFLRTPMRTAADINAQSEVVGLEHLEAAEAEGHGVILVTGHFGNWEWFGQWFASTGRKLTTVARDANQDGINDRLTKLRLAAGFETMSRGSAARGALVRLRRKEYIGLLVDQNAGDIFVPFFGKPCGTVTGPAVLSGRTKAPVMLGFAIWLAPGRYRLVFQPALQPVEGEDVTVSLTTAINASLEAIIRQYPEQWLWLHDRWKSARQKGML